MSKTVPSTSQTWREFSRQAPPARSARERLSDFLQVNGVFDEAAAREQASRCIECPSPSCVSGCPLCSPIPKWIQLTAEGRFLEAAELLGKAGGLSDICSRLCPADQCCEHTCILGSVADPVSIAGLERFLADYAARHEAVNSVTAPPNGFTIAVLGSGPCGLACADDLARAGCSVSIFEPEAAPGGWLREGVPSFKLESAVLEQRVAVLQKQGVKLELNSPVMAEGALQQLRDQFDVVFIGRDWREPRKLNIPGDTLAGVIQGNDLLAASREDARGGPRLEIPGRRVAVIGGGIMAVDCARIAVRGGAREVICLCRRGESDLLCSRQDYREAVEEGVRFSFQTIPVALRQAANGEGLILELARTEAGALESDGRHAFSIMLGTTFELEASLVVAALGYQAKAAPRHKDWSQLSTTSDGALAVDENMMTSVPGIFAAGDMVRGPLKVLTAVREGRRAAEEILAHLRSTRPS